MAALGPFEPQPHLAVALSGGPDSLALVALADAWARARGGRVTALTVDHGLRPESTAEARRVAGWMAARGIDHHILPWTDPKPPAGVQAVARDARYALLTDWCRRAGVLHLLLGHQRNDQAETVVMRRRRNNTPGLWGRAGMAALVEGPHARLLRPLLDVPAGPLREWAGADCIADPSNVDWRFERARARADLDNPAVVDALWREARADAGARQADEARMAALLARCAQVHPAGFAQVDAPTLLAAADAAPALGRLLMVVGGLAHGPPRAGLDSLVRHLAGGAPGASLGRCVLSRRGDALRIAREARRLPLVAVRGGDDVMWDRRFRMRLDGPGTATLGPLGAAGWAALVAARPDLRGWAWPAARAALPTLWDGDGPVQVPHLQYLREPVAPGVRIGHIVFSPPNAAGGVGFFALPDGFGVLSQEGSRRGLSVIDGKTGRRGDGRPNQ